jgi:dTDP-4-dehydrorhamnose 3,5-epimerase
MIFDETLLKGAYITRLEPLEDERGFFARSYCRREFAAQGLDFDIVQCSISFNRRKGTLRGMHYQAAPHVETRLVSCTGGAIYDVIVDLRADSPTFHQWFGVELSAANRLSLYVPAGFAHGFITLCDNAVVYYQMSEYYHPECARGVRWDDPAFGIKWPAQPLVISDRDRGYR